MPSTPPIGRGFLRKNKYIGFLELADKAVGATYLETNKKILELSINAKSLWNQANPEEKLGLVKEVYSNSLLNGLTVEYQMKNHFKLLADLKKSAKNQDGARQAIMVEPSTTSKEYSVVWRRPRIDLDEFVYQKTVNKLSYGQLAAYFNRSKSSIDVCMRTLRKKGKL